MYGQGIKPACRFWSKKLPPPKKKEPLMVARLKKLSPKLNVGSLCKKLILRLKLPSYIAHNVSIYQKVMLICNVWYRKTSKHCFSIKRICRKLSEYNT